MAGASTQYAECAALQDPILPHPARRQTMAKKFPMHPKHPERICWGCDRYCPTDAMSCGNGSDRTMHPIELLGDDWASVGDWGFEETDDARHAAQTAATQAPQH
jgi:hypothetical protein